MAPCLLFFPIGLLSLLYTRTVEVSFGLPAASEGTDVLVSGMAPSWLQGEIAQELPSLSAERSDR